MTSMVCSVAIHESVKADPVAWSKLAYLGTVPAFTPGGVALELRTCPACHSTLSKPVSPVSTDGAAS